MFELLLKNFAMHVSLEPEEQDYVVSLLGKRNIKNKTILLNAGQTCRSIYFINKGCLRMYYTDRDGGDHIIMFCPENWWATDIASFSAKEPSQFSMDAIEDTEIFYLNFDTLEVLYSKIPRLERFFRILTQNGYSIQQRRINSSLSDSAIERYKIFREEYPNLEQRISQKHIASYLGITPVFLSRLRQQL